MVSSFKFIRNKSHLGWKQLKILIISHEKLDYDVDLNFIYWKSGETQLSSNPKEGEDLSKRLLLDTEIVRSYCRTISTGSTTASRIYSPVPVDIRNKPTINIPVEEDYSFRQETSKVRNGNSPRRRRESRAHRNRLNIRSPTPITNSNLPPLQ